MDMIRLLSSAVISFVISMTYFLIKQRKTDAKIKALENELNITWKKYTLKAIETDNLKKRINQTYNKPII